MLDDKTVKTIKNIIYTHVNPKDTKVFIFGSWATGTARKYSDIDIGLEGKMVNARLIQEITNAFEDSDLPYTVDVVDFGSVSNKFKTIATQKIIYLSHD